LSGADSHKTGIAVVYVMNGRDSATSDVSTPTLKPAAPPADPARVFGRYAEAWRLDLFDRILLLGDGTVTTLLEACVGAPIATRTTRQAGPAGLETLVAETGAWWHPDAAQLRLAAGEEVIARRSVLHDRSNGLAYVLAESLLVPDRIPSKVTGSLFRAGSSIGRIINGNSIETRRELVQLGQMRAGDASDYLDIEPGATVVWRTYQIMIAGRPALLISEIIVPGRLSASALGSVLPLGADR
jgi:chorismate-pyruvate lyase